MITLEKAKTLTHRAVLTHVVLKNKDGSPLRARVNGKLKQYSRDPSRWFLPMKHGLRDCFYINESNCNEWKE